MKRISILLCALVVAALCTPAALAADGTTILLDTKAMTLEPGTKIRAQIGAEYIVDEVPKVARPKRGESATITMTDDMIKYRIPAKNTVVWEITVPASGQLQGRRFELRFAEKLLAPPPGMLARVSFPITFKLVKPDGTIKDRTYTFGMAINDDAPATISRCFRVYGGPDKGFGVGVHPTCDWVADPKTTRTYKAN